MWTKSSLTALYTEEAGWPYGHIRDDDAVYVKEAELGGAHPVREAGLFQAYDADCLSGGGQTTVTLRNSN